MTPKSMSMNHRLLAVDVRPQRLGYAVLETPAQLLDFGGTRVDSPHASLRRVNALVTRHSPTIVVFRKIGPRSTRNRPLTKAIIRLISQWARHCSIPVAVVSDRHMKVSLGGDQVITKNQIASLLASAFPELAWRLPQPRKPWQPEVWNMMIFDALALGMSYLASQHDESVIQKLAVARRVLSPVPRWRS